MPKLFENHIKKTPLNSFFKHIIYEFKKTTKNVLVETAGLEPATFRV